MNKRMWNRHTVGVALTAGIAMAAIVLTGHPAAQAQFEDTPTVAADELDIEFEIGTYDPQLVFHNHPAQEKLMEAIAVLQRQTQEARQAGDEQEAQRLQQLFEQQRVQIFEEFQRDVYEALPAVADDAGIKVVAINVVYRAEDVGTRDITRDLIDAFSEETEGEPGQTTSSWPRTP